MAENANLQQEITAIEEELRKKRAVLEQQTSGEFSTVAREKEALREIIGNQIKSAGEEEQRKQKMGAESSGYSAHEDKPAYLSEELRPRVQELVDRAFNVEKSIFGVIRDVVKNSIETKNFTLVDAFHDALVDELFDMLVEKKMIKKL